MESFWPEHFLSAFCDVSSYFSGLRWRGISNDNWVHLDQSEGALWTLSCTLCIWFLKVQYVVFGKNFIIATKKRSSSSDFKCLNKLNKQTLLFPWLKLQSDLKGQHDFMLFYFVYMSWTLPPFCLLVFWGPYFPLRTACIFSYGKIQYFWIWIITLAIL